jgi:hypothetical protein
MIADGRLKPGAAAPTGLALAALTGFSPKTCNTALEMLVQDGVLSRGSRGDTRPRVAPETGAGANFAADRSWPAPLVPCRQPLTCSHTWLIAALYWPTLAAPGMPTRCRAR